MIKKLVRKIIGEKNTNKIKVLIGYKYINKFKGLEKKKKIIYMLIPQHGNMGDQAITLATIKYLEDNFSEYNIIEIYREDTYRYQKAIKNIINNDDLIILHGGGNMGNLYPVEEIDRRYIVESFLNNKIISMPQTINFSKDIEGESELLKSKNIYNSHNSLNLIAREKVSYEIMKNEFEKNNIILNPDIVFYLNNIYVYQKYKRSRIMTCLRSDKESILGSKKNDFIKELNKYYNKVFNYDTVINKVINKENREEELNKMFKQFLESKIVITDRLHGMVFSAITKTPCIVTKSLDHKVIGTYDWIKDLNYIKLVDNLEFENIKPLIDELLALKEYNEIDLNNEYFYKLKDRLLGEKNV